MSNYASDCIRTLDFLLRKHDALLRECIHTVDTLKACRAEDRPHPPLITVEEHDRLMALCRTTELSLNQLSRQVGRSPTILSRIRSGKHPLYDRRRCGPPVEVRHD